MSRDRSPDLAVVRPGWAVVIRSFAFLRKEVVEIVRQPRLIALLVLGPFALLLLFGAGYAESEIVRRALFVGPPGSIYEELHDSYEGDLDQFIESHGMVATEAEGRAALRAGEVDIVVIFPPDPHETVLAGERAVITVLHDQIDPIQQAAIEFASQLAIHEVNATVLATLAGDAQTRLAPASEIADDLAVAGESVRADPVGTRDEMRDELDLLGDALDGSSTILARLDGGDPELVAEVERARLHTRDVVDRLERVDAGTSDAELDALGEAMTVLASELESTAMLDPNVIVRPFASDTANVVAADVGPTDYFTPASIALLLQHLALTFAALSLVRDRRTGLFELMRVGPLSSLEIIIGKFFAYLLVGSVVGALLVGASALALGVPLVGSVAWVAVIVVGVLLASLALGMVLAIAAQTESQAVQYAMLALLAGLFFSGFVLPIEGLTHPVRIVSWLLPVTHGIESLQDVMLRGREPSTAALVGLAALVIGYGTLAVIGLRRRLRVSTA